MISLQQKKTRNFSGEAELAYSRSHGRRNAPGVEPALPVVEIARGRRSSRIERESRDARPSDDDVDGAVSGRASRVKMTATSLARAGTDVGGHKGDEGRSCAPRRAGTSPSRYTIPLACSLSRTPRTFDSARDFEIAPWRGTPRWLKHHCFMNSKKQQHFAK